MTGAIDAVPGSHRVSARDQKPPGLRDPAAPGELATVGRLGAVPREHRTAWYCCAEPSDEQRVGV